MTKRELYNAIINNEITEEVVNAVKAELEALDKRNSSRASSNAAKRAEEYAPLMEQIRGVLSYEKDMLTADIAVAVGLSPSKVSAVLRKMGDEVIKSDIKVKGKGTQKGYRLAR